MVGRDEERTLETAPRPTRASSRTSSFGSPVGVIGPSYKVAFHLEGFLT
jgi:hypothetical protein